MTAARPPVVSYDCGRGSRTPTRWSSGTRTSRCTGPRPTASRSSTPARRRSAAVLRRTRWASPPRAAAGSRSRWWRSEHSLDGIFHLRNTRSSDDDDRRRLDRARRSAPSRGAGAVARAPADGDRAGRAAGRETAERIEAPQGPARGGAGVGAGRAPAPGPRGRAAAARRVARVARALPHAVGRPARRARAPAGRDRAELMSEHGTYTTDDGRPAVRFERRLAHPVEHVWRRLTEPEELRHWFPSSVEFELRVG